MPALSDVSPPQPAKGRWSDLALRATSALVLGPLALVCMWVGGTAWDLLIGVAMAGLGHEWATLAKRDHAWPLAAVLLIVWGMSVLFGPLAGIEAVLALGLASWPVFGRFPALGVPYAGLGGIALLWLRHRPGAGLVDVFYLLLVIWGTDIGAYLVGRLIGGRKLAPSISPGKTVSGAVGGLVIGALCGALLAGFTLGEPLAAFGVGLALSAVAQAGDLLESAIKRKLGVKDSGRTIPGHGGLFDRLDGFLTAAPLAALLAVCMQGGVGLWG
ncbi:phosphatidate cytidylyltransferase [Acidocella facilis]|uniref:phosphatidate cytidylyltransferase n=1 Tax=Acidocella facilis TaxID=525 RepID=UPI002E16D4C7